MLSTNSFSGSFRACGQAYGSTFSELIRGFCFQECRPNKRNLKYAKQCLRQIEKFAPNSAIFIEGLANGAGLTPAEVTLLTLHEEIYHLRMAKSSHCSVLGVSGSAAKGAGSIIGQNWDWPLNYSPWSGLLQLNINNNPRLSTYHYPGLWACTGVNSNGLGLVWSAGGYLPVIKPRIGVPTYILTFEILLRNSVEQVLKFLDQTPRAGAFIFTIADKKNLSTIEATPTKLAYVQRLERAVRSSYYCYPKIIQNSKQNLSVKAAKLSLQSLRKLSQAAVHIKNTSWQEVAELLSLKGVLQKARFDPFTHDQIVIDCKTPALHTRRVGVKVMGPWQKLKA